MPIFHRSRIIIDGVRRTRTYRFFRCPHFDRTVRISSYSSNPSNSVCPLCYNQLTQELHANNSSTSLPPAQILDAMVHILSDHLPTRREPTGVRHMAPVTPSDQERSDNDPTAENDSMVYLIVTQNMLTHEPHCPICKEDFEVNEEIRALPCTHFYHLPCILHWLQNHSTCPVCRYQLPVQPVRPTNNSADIGFDNSNLNGISDDNYDEFRFNNDVFSVNWPSWSEVLSLWPFNIRTFMNRTFQYGDGPLRDSASTRAGVLFWQRFLSIL